MQRHPWDHVVQQTITVDLARTLDGVVTTYLRNGRRLPMQPADPRSLDAALIDLLDILRAGDRAQLDRVLAGRPQLDLGASLYALLFPEPEVANALFRELSGSPAATVRPERTPLRVRIVAADDALLGLPWALTRSPDGVHLATAEGRWTFEHSTRRVGDEAVHLPSGAKVLLACPPDPATARFADQLRSRLRQGDESYASPVFFRVATTPDALREALDDQRPHVLVYVGPTRQLNGQPALCFGDAGPVDPLRLRSWMPRSVKLAIVTGRTAGGTLAGFGRQLGDLAPAVIVRLGRVWSDDALAMTRHWLTGALFDGMQPAQVAHTHPLDVDLTTPHAWTHAVHTRYATWRLDRRPTRTARTHPGKVSHRLDRFNQRAAFRARLDTFLGSTAKVLAVVGTAPDDADACAEHLSDLLREDLIDTRSDRLDFKDWHVSFPPGEDTLLAAFEDALRAAIGAGAGPLDRFIREAAPRPHRDHHACLWLDYGQLGGQSTRHLTRKRLDEWLAMCSRLIEPHTPTPIRVIVFLTADTRRHDTIKAAVSRFRRRVHPTGVMPIALGVLEHVERDELDEFMYTKGATSCPPGLLEDATDKLFEACRGIGGADDTRANYRCLVDHIDRIEETGWMAFVDQDTDDGIDPYEPL